MASTRRLAKDHASLQRALPPNYLFPHTSDPITEAFPDDLTSLAVYLTGPTFTPYTSGLFLLHLRIPPTFPTSPPAASFRTKIFHPNVDEKTGAICLETLKRDWDPKLTLKDILVHISCLLVQPNPDSALNENAGVLVRDDYSAFERKARLMTKIHASIPADYAEEALRARQSGDEPEKPSDKPVKSQVKEAGRVLETKSQVTDPKGTLSSTNGDNSKASSMNGAAGSAANTILGKRAIVTDPSTASATTNGDIGTARRNGETGEPMRKSPKHKHEAESTSEDSVSEKPTESGEDKENQQLKIGSEDATKVGDGLSSGGATRPPFVRKVSNLESGKLRPYARIGIRRL